MPCCKVDKLRERESSELVSMMELRAHNRSNADNCDGVCCACRGQRVGSMLRCRLCLDLCHCMYISSLASLLNTHSLEWILN